MFDPRCSPSRDGEAVVPDFSERPHSGHRLSHASRSSGALDRRIASRAHALKALLLATIWEGFDTDDNATEREGAERIAAKEPEPH